MGIKMREGKEMGVSGGRRKGNVSMLKEGKEEGRTRKEGEGGVE